MGFMNGEEDLLLHCHMAFLPLTRKDLSRKIKLEYNLLKSIKIVVKGAIHGEIY
jgi:hypothetical protein